MTISKSWFSYLARAFALFLCTALLLSFVSCSDSTTSQEPKVVNSTYTVKHLLQNLQDDNYTENEEAAEQKSGTYGTQTAAVAKTYEGFTAKTFEQETIKAEGSTVVEIYYDRNTYTISYSSTYGEPPASKPVKYGYVLETEDIPDLSETNYSFKGWFADGISIAEGYIVKKDITLTAQWRSQTGFILTLMTGTDIIITEDSNTFTATPSVAGTYTYTWYLNEVQQSSTTNTFTLDTTGMAPGYYTLTVTAVSDSIQSTSSYQITVSGE